VKVHVQNIKEFLDAETGLARDWLMKWDEFTVLQYKEDMFRLSNSNDALVRSLERQAQFAVGQALSDHWKNKILNGKANEALDKIIRQHLDEMCKGNHASAEAAYNRAAAQYRKNIISQSRGIKFIESVRFDIYQLVGLPMVR